MAEAEGFEPSALGFGVSCQHPTSVDWGRNRTGTVGRGRRKSTGLATPLAIPRRPGAVSGKPGETACCGLRMGKAPSRSGSASLIAGPACAQASLSLDQFQPGGRLISSPNAPPRPERRTKRTASRSRALRTSGPPVPCRFLLCPSVLNFAGRRVPLCPPVSQVPRMRA